MSLRKVNARLFEDTANPLQQVAGNTDVRMPRELPVWPSHGPNCQQGAETAAEVTAPARAEATRTVAAHVVGSARFLVYLFPMR